MSNTNNGNSAELEAELERVRVQVSTLEQLLEVHEETALVQAQKLERALEDLQEQSSAREQLQEELIRRQAVALLELSTPLIPITDTVVVMPLIGPIDTQRAQQVLETMLEGVGRHSPDVVILDITGVAVVDTHIADLLLRAARAVKLLGTQIMLTGIRPDVAAMLVSLDVDLRDIITHGTLQKGITTALAHK